MRKTFAIDWISIPVFLLSTYIGIEPHIARHGNDHEIWHNWAVFHIIANILFLITGTYHIKTHWGWHKKLLQKRTPILRKSFR